MAGSRLYGSLNDAMAAYERSRFDRGRWIALVAGLAFVGAGVAALCLGELGGIAFLVAGLWAVAVARVGFQIHARRRGERG